jgi:hypothetical protein
MQRRTVLRDPSIGRLVALAAIEDGGAAAGLGPLVRRTVGDGSEIFAGEERDSTARTIETMLGAGIPAFVAMLADVMAQGPLSWAVYGMAVSTSIVWLSARGWRRRRRFSRTRLAGLLGPPGAAGAAQPVRIVGTVEAGGDAFDAPGCDQKVVFSRTLFFQAGYRDWSNGNAFEEIRGVPLRVRLESGAVVNLQPAEVHLADRPRLLKDVPADVMKALGAAARSAKGLFRARFEQATLAAGDRVELVGHLTAQVDPDGQGAPARGSPLAHVLVPPAGGHIWVRRLPG